MVWDVVAQPCPNLCPLEQTLIMKEWLELKQPEEPGAQEQWIGSVRLQAWRADEMCCVVAS